MSPPPKINKFTKQLNQTVAKQDMSVPTTPGFAQTSLYYHKQQGQMTLYLLLQANPLPGSSSPRCPGLVSGAVLAECE